MGEPKTPAKLRQSARELADDALVALRAIVTGTGQDAVRLAAAREVLDRGYGPVKTAAAKARPAARAGKAAPAPYTVVVRRLGDPVDADLEDFE